MSARLWLITKGEEGKKGKYSRILAFLSLFAFFASSWFVVMVHLKTILIINGLFTHIFDV
jgi:hypothetical protein